LTGESVARASCCPTPARGGDRRFLGPVPSGPDTQAGRKLTLGYAGRAGSWKLPHYPSVTAFESTTVAPGLLHPPFSPSVVVYNLRSRPPCSTTPAVSSLSHHAALRIIRFLYHIRGDEVEKKKTPRRETRNRGIRNRGPSATMAESINLEEIHNTLVAIAFEAGRMILAANPSSISTGTKLNCISCPTFPRLKQSQRAEGPKRGMLKLEPWMPVR